MNPLYYLKAIIAALTSASAVLTHAASTNGRLTAVDYIVAGGTAIVVGATTYAAGNKSNSAPLNSVQSPANAPLEFPPNTVILPAHSEAQLTSMSPDALPGSVPIEPPGAEQPNSPDA